MEVELFTDKYKWFDNNAQYAEHYISKTIDGYEASFDYNNYTSCPKCGARVSGAYWMKPRILYITRHTPPDFLYTVWGDASFVVSENAYRKIVESGIAGIKNAEKIDNVIFWKKPKEDYHIQDYYYIWLHSSQITIDYQNSDITRMGGNDSGVCSLCNQVPGPIMSVKKLAFNMDLYEGYDIFHTYELGGYCFYSKRFVDFCKREHLTNLQCVPLYEYRYEAIPDSWK